MFQAFRAKTLSLPQIANAFVEKAETAFSKLESLIISLITAERDNIGYEIFFERRESLYDFSIFCIKILHVRSSVERFFDTTRAKSKEEDAYLIKIWKPQWVKNIRNLLGQPHLPEEKTLKLNILGTLLNLHTLLDITLQNIKKIQDKTGFIKFQVLNKAYRTLLQDLMPFKKTEYCSKYFVEMDTQT